MTPLISCIVPAFNAERFLGEALDSILAQTWRPLEVIVVDDGSTDGTAGVAERYGERITYICQANAGPAAARNRGLDAATGAYVAFLDADDVWHEEKLSRQMARFDARPELELCLAHIQNFWEPEFKDEEDRLRDHRFSKPIPAYVTQAMLARRTLFDVVGQFDTTLRIVDDTDWFLRAADRGTVTEVMPVVLISRRLHESNISRDHLTVFDSLPKLFKASLDRRRQSAKRSDPDSGES
jgi:glycosyltransferase involved in cell wall biosynthesis